MALAYADGVDGRADGPAGAAASGSGRQRLFSRYVDVMLHRRPHPHYPPTRTTTWLTTLARELRRRGQTVFMLDLIDETWSARNPRVPARVLARLAGLLGLGAVLGLTGWWFADRPGLVAAAGLLVLALLMSVRHHPALGAVTTRFPVRRRADPDGHGRLTGAALAVVDVVRHQPSTVAVGGLAVPVGIFAAGLSTGGFTVTRVLGYGVGFFVAGLATYAVVETVEDPFPLRPAAPAAGRHEVPGPLVRQRLTCTLRTLAPLGVATGLLGWALVAYPAGEAAGIRFGTTVGSGAMATVLALAALTPIAEQWLLRRRLDRQRVVPYPLRPFLAYAVQCLFLRQVGDGYIFVHRELLDHFAAGPEAIPRRPAGPAAEPVTEGRPAG